MLTLPSPLARAVAYDAPLAAQVFGLLADELGRWYRRAARAKGISAPHAGCVLEVQRFADGALLYPHAHVIAPEGVFHETETGAVRFVRLPPPKDADVEAIVARVDARVRRLLARRAKGSADELEEAHPHQLLVVLRPPRLRRSPRLPRSRARGECASPPPDDRVVGPSAWTTRHRPRKKRLCARSDAGFELHAEVHVPAHDRAALERLCRYLARPHPPRMAAEDRLVQAGGWPHRAPLEAHLEGRGSRPRVRPGAAPPRPASRLASRP